MKKHLIAIAALVATGATYAQVTLYGAMDTGYTQITTTVITAGAAVDTRNHGINSSNLAPSFWGIKGSEDLGGGLRANFNLEADLNTDNGAAPAVTWGRTSTVGLSGSFGSINLGRSATPLYVLVDSNDVFGTSGASTVSLYPDGVTATDAIFYSSPALGGFGINLMYGNSETGTNLAPVAAKNTGLSVTYAAGALNVGFGWGLIEGTSGAGVSNRTDGTSLGGSYDFGPAKLFAAYTRARVQANTAVQTYTDDAETNVGLSVPVGALTFMAGYGRNTRSQTTAGVELAGNTGTGSDLVLGLTYTLSKRTTAYVKTGTYDKFDFGSANGNKVAATALGVRHTF